MIDIRRLSPSTDVATYHQVWRWMQAQPELYEHLHGFGDFSAFIRPNFPVLDFALKVDGKLIAFAAWIYRGEKRCQFCLVTPPNVKPKVLLAALYNLQALYFLQLSFDELYIHLRPLPQYNKARRLAKRMGWTRVNDDLWTMTLTQYLDSHFSPTLCPEAILIPPRGQ